MLLTIAVIIVAYYIGSNMGTIQGGMSYLPRDWQIDCVSEARELKVILVFLIKVVNHTAKNNRERKAIPIAYFLFTHQHTHIKKYN